MKILDAQTKLKENPFYESNGLLNMFQQLPKVGTNPHKPTVFAFLKDAYVECDTLEKKQVFYSIMFSIGDISNREHNLFKRKNLKKVENGGTSLRKAFIYCLEWMLTYNKETENQFYEFLPIIGEYTNNKNYFFYEIRTDRRKGNVLETIKLPINIDKVTEYISNILKDSKTTDETKTLWAKFLPRPSLSRRKRINTVLEGREKSVSKKLGYDVSAGDTFVKYYVRQSATVEKENFEYELILNLSAKMDWDIIKYPKNTKFVGFEQFKKMYLSNTEASLFSNKTILNFNKEQFIEWLDKLPSNARFRVQTRLFNIVNGIAVSTKKWINSFGYDLADWFKEWESIKLKAQNELLSLSEEDKKEMSKEQLKKMEKAAKVNTGAETLVTALAKVKAGNVSGDTAKLISQNVLNKVVCNVPVFIWTDISGSMMWDHHKVTIEGVEFYPLELSMLATTAFLMKNPNAELSSVFGMFSSETTIIADNSFYRSGNKPNRWVHSDSNLIKNQTIVDKTKSFIDNYNNIKNIISGYSMGSTDINSVAVALKRWVDSDPETKAQRIEIIQSYPVFLFISDGDFNSMYSPSASLLKFRQDMKQWFGWDGLTVIWDVKPYGNDGDKFRGIPNTMYFGSTNPGTLTQIFQNMHDLDIVDDFAPLQALSRTTRYEPVRELVYVSAKKNNTFVKI